PARRQLRRALDAGRGRRAALRAVGGQGTGPLAGAHRRPAVGERQRRDALRLRERVPRAVRTARRGGGARAHRPRAQARGRRVAAAPQGDPGAPPVARISFLGDVLLGADAEETLRREGYGYALAEVRPALAGADLVVANLEGPVTDAPVKQRPGRHPSWNYRAD